MKIMDQGYPQPAIARSKTVLEVVTTEPVPLELQNLQTQLFEREFSPSEQDDIDDAFRLLLPYAKYSTAIATALLLMLGHPIVYGCRFSNLRPGKLLLDTNDEKGIVFTKNDLNHGPEPITYYLNVDTLY